MSRGLPLTRIPFLHTVSNDRTAGSRMQQQNHRCYHGYSPTLIRSANTLPRHARITCSGRLSGTTARRRNRTAVCVFVDAFARACAASVEGGRHGNSG
jgi:hypothetical protein